MTIRELLQLFEVEEETIESFGAALVAVATVVEEWTPVVARVLEEELPKLFEVPDPDGLRAMSVHFAPRGPV